MIAGYPAIAFPRGKARFCLLSALWAFNKDFSGGQNNISNTSKRLLALALALVMVLGLAACGSSAPATPAATAAPAAPAAPAAEASTSVEPEAAGPDTFSMIDNFDITTLDYVYNNKSSNGDYTSNFIEGLLTQDPHGNLVAGMAKEWSANDDASEWTFTIRDDAV